jgi:hypothetical protein
MKKFIPFLAVLFLTAFGAKAATASEDRLVPNYVLGYGSEFIFIEDGITFSVYPDGEFDFFIDNRVNVGVGTRRGNIGVTFNSGFNYNPFVQYDDYGAIIQIENVPVFYDFYGRVSQIGGVDVWYRNGLVRRIGGLNVFWNGGAFSHYTGFINIYNRHYVYRPFHRWFARPAVGFCNVWRTPYRRFYNPVRYTWHRPYRNNIRRSYANVGREHRYNRTPRRSTIYRNDKRVAVRDNNGRRNGDYGRSNRSYNRGQNSVTERRTVSRSNRGDGIRINRNRTAVDRSRSVKSSTIKRGESVTRRSNRGNTVNQRTVTRTPRSTTVTKRSVTRTPEKRTVTKRSTTYKKPQARTNRAMVNNGRTVNRTSSVKRSTPTRNTVSRSSSTTNRSTVSRSSSSRSNNRSTSTRARSSRKL